MAIKIYNKKALAQLETLKARAIPKWPKSFIKTVIKTRFRNIEKKEILRNC